MSMANKLIPNKTRLSRPALINLELTDACNVKCRHCYNFWREDNDLKFKLDIKEFDRLVERFLEAGIFHVVLTGGEPLANFRVLEYALQKLSDNNISTSVNSNLMLATDEKIQRLRKLSNQKKLHNFIMNFP